MGPSYPYRSFPLDLPLLLEGEDPQWFPFLQNPFPITLVLDGFGNPADGKSPFLAKNFARNLFLAQNKPPPPQPLHLLALSHFKRWSSLCVLIPLTAQGFKLCSKPRKALQTVFAGGPPSVNWRHHVPESYSRANEAPALGAAFPPPIIHRTAPRALTTPPVLFCSTNPI